MITITIYDPSVEPEPLIKELRYNTVDWQQTKAIAAAVQALVDESLGIEAE